MTELLCDPARWRDAPLVHDERQIQERNPQRFEMALLHGIVHHDLDGRLGLGVHHSRPDDFWVRGHIPGRPLMPAVVMVEIAAQLCSWLASHHLDAMGGGFFGFGGLEGCRFRGQVRPGDTLLVAAQILKLRRRFALFDTQAWVGDELVYEGRISGVVL
jgi:3-hydroxyacyl-[acyl-carrier-protein] dehydratase